MYKKKLIIYLCTWASSASVVAILPTRREHEYLLYSYLDYMSS